ncbi:hypothetical protein NOCARDAX2BIS_610007 [Nocardioides sp. AX2bis]|nr:hypothetical protein NOCARDAX2BIS_610007 [Nocardioides sp. AX2bis]
MYTLDGFSLLTHLGAALGGILIGILIGLALARGR